MDDKYLRGRPFLVVEFIQRPKADINTRIKGWSSNPDNMQAYEQVSIVDRIGSKQLRAQVVIDIINSSVVRNVTVKDAEELVSYYVSRYSEKIKQALQAWAQSEIKANMSDLSKNR